MDVRVLGNVEVHTDSTVLTLERAPQRCVLATLALNAGRPVHVGQLVEHVWGDRPPARAADTIASYVRAVRRIIVQAGGHRDWLGSRRPGAYLLNIDPSLVDYHRFGQLVATARDRAQAGAHPQAVAGYQQALALRRGDALANVSGDWALRCRYGLEQEHLDVLCALYEQQLLMGSYTAVATSATHLITDVIPTDRMIILGMYALAHSGQHAHIRDFLTRASQRMWDTVEAKPSAEIETIARKLITRPDAALPLPSPLPTVDARDHDPGQPVADNPPAPAPPATATIVVMTASHNKQVYQAGGDQYIDGS